MNVKILIHIRPDEKHQKSRVFLAPKKDFRGRVTAVNSVRQLIKSAEICERYGRRAVH